jgi:hypothetical protein
METKEYSSMLLIVDNAYFIEESETYKRISSKGIKTVEYVRLQENKLMFIEAKETFAREGQLNRDHDFQKESQNVADKFVHSLNLLSSIALNIKKDDISSVTNQTVKPKLVFFILVIHRSEIAECKKIRKEITQILNENLEIRKIWQPTVLVLNYDQALKKVLAVAQQV